ncbi:MAG: hypothetical protein AYK19_01070 [Theionarchaea archaeon DG-70-1]|nr:MAG: hypothetical protein AYK19_01070 [Theionarchaea archaeon DG-70-1]
MRFPFNSYYESWKEIEGYKYKEKGTQIYSAEIGLLLIICCEAGTGAFLTALFVLKLTSVQKSYTEFDRGIVNSGCFSHFCYTCNKKLVFI